MYTIEQLQNDSIENKLDIVFSIALKFYNDIETPYYEKLLDTSGKKYKELLKTFDITMDDYDLIHSTLDGGFHMAVSRQINGTCSLQAIIDFDIEELETNLNNTILHLQTMYTKSVVVMNTF